MALVLILVAIVTATNIGDATSRKTRWAPCWRCLTFVGVPIGTALAFGEEFGWRGYLLAQAPSFG